ncbi:MAG TPA: hypothetical protein VKA53_00610 [Thermoanaerobaculia bacterium]|nr:hypothetical protein [Thermoanaerobaculia bacterium]
MPAFEASGSRLVFPVTLLSCYDPPVQSTFWRAATAAGLTSAWLVLLMSGGPLARPAYALLAAALVVFPWRALGAGARDDGQNPRRDR